MERKQCQIQCLPQMANAPGKAERLWQLRNRLKRICKRRWNYLSNLMARTNQTKEEISALLKGREKEEPLQPGDTVRVHSKEQIETTLDRWNQLKKCSFMEEMWSYCGTTQRVFKRIEKFLDERDYLMKSCKGIVILQGVFCEGTRDFGQCDRSCFFFWREEWLQKIEDASNGKEQHSIRA